MTRRSAALVLQLADSLINMLQTTTQVRWIVDGGCHTGAFSQAAIRQFPSANILAFEPDPESWTIARHNLENHPQIEIVCAALGNEYGQAEFFRGPFTATNSLLPRPANTLRPYYPEGADLEGGTYVKVVTLDEECERRGIHSLDVLKLDLQGGEIAALRGARSLLESDAIRVVIIEVVFIRKYQDQPLFWEVWRELESCGYTLHSLEEVKIGLYHNEPVSPRHQQWNQADAIFVSAALREAIDR